MEFEIINHGEVVDESREIDHDSKGVIANGQSTNGCAMNLSDDSASWCAGFESEEDVDDLNKTLLFKQFACSYSPNATICSHPVEGNGVTSDHLEGDCFQMPTNTELKTAANDWPEDPEIYQILKAVDTEEKPVNEDIVEPSFDSLCDRMVSNHKDQELLKSPVILLSDDMESLSDVFSFLTTPEIDQVLKAVESAGGNFSELLNDCFSFASSVDDKGQELLESLPAKSVPVSNESWESKFFPITSNRTNELNQNLNDEQLQNLKSYFSNAVKREKISKSPIKLYLSKADVEKLLGYLELKDSRTSIKHQLDDSRKSDVVRDCPSNVTAGEGFAFEDESLNVVKFTHAESDLGWLGELNSEIDDYLGAAWSSNCNESAINISGKASSNVAKLAHSNIQQDFLNHHDSESASDNSASMSSSNVTKSASANSDQGCLNPDDTKPASDDQSSDNKAAELSDDCGYDKRLSDNEGHTLRPSLNVTKCNHSNSDQDWTNNSEGRSARDGSLFEVPSNVPKLTDANTDKRCLNFRDDVTAKFNEGSTKASPNYNKPSNANADRECPNLTHTNSVAPDKTATDGSAQVSLNVAKSSRANTNQGYLYPSTTSDGPASKASANIPKSTCGNSIYKSSQKHSKARTFSYRRDKMQEWFRRLNWKQKEVYDSWRAEGHSHLEALTNVLDGLSPPKKTDSALKAKPGSDSDELVNASSSAETSVCGKKKLSSTPGSSSSSITEFPSSAESADQDYPLSTICNSTVNKSSNNKTSKSSLDASEFPVAHTDVNLHNPSELSNIADQYCPNVKSSDEKLAISWDAAKSAYANTNQSCVNPCVTNNDSASKVSSNIAKSTHADPSHNSLQRFSKAKTSSYPQEKMQEWFRRLNWKQKEVYNSWREEGLSHQGALNHVLDGLIPTKKPDSALKAKPGSDADELCSMSASAFEEPSFSSETRSPSKESSSNHKSKSLLPPVMRSSSAWRGQKDLPPAWETQTQPSLLPLQSGNQPFIDKSAIIGAANVSLTVDECAIANTNPGCPSPSNANNGSSREASSNLPKSASPNPCYKSYQKYSETKKSHYRQVEMEAFFQQLNREQNNVYNAWRAMGFSHLEALTKVLDGPTRNTASALMARSGSNADELNSMSTFASKKSPSCHEKTLSQPPESFSNLRNRFWLPEERSNSHKTNSFLSPVLKSSSDWPDLRAALLPVWENRPRPSLLPHPQQGPVGGTSQPPAQEIGNTAPPEWERQPRPSSLPPPQLHGNQPLLGGILQPPTKKIGNTLPPIWESKTRPPLLTLPQKSIYQALMGGISLPPLPIWDIGVAQHASAVGNQNKFSSYSSGPQYPKTPTTVLGASICHKSKGSFGEQEASKTSPFSAEPSALPKLGALDGPKSSWDHSFSGGNRPLNAQTEFPAHSPSRLWTFPKRKNAYTHSDEPKRRRSSDLCGDPATSGDMLLYIVPSGNPNAYLSNEQMDAIEDSILETIVELTNDASLEPTFKEVSRHDGRYKVICENELSKRWLYKYASRIHPWPNESLKIIPAACAEEEDTKMRASAVVPCNVEDWLLRQTTSQLTAFNRSTNQPTFKVPLDHASAISQTRTYLRGMSGNTERLVSPQRRLSNFEGNNRSSVQRSHQRPMEQAHNYPTSFAKYFPTLQ